MAGVTDFPTSMPDCISWLEQILIITSVSLYPMWCGIVFLMVDLVWGASGWVPGQDLSALLCYMSTSLGSLLCFPGPSLLATHCPLTNFGPAAPSSSHQQGNHDAASPDSMSLLMSVIIPTGLVVFNTEANQKYPLNSLWAHFAAGLEPKAQA